MKKQKSAPRGWIKITPIVHIGRRRIAKLLPLRVEPGRKYILGSPTSVRAVAFKVMGAGYEFGAPVIHLRLTDDAFRDHLEKMA